MEAGFQTLKNANKAEVDIFKNESSLSDHL